jgi:predicted transcriptional regulator
MGKPQKREAFVCSEPEVEVDAETSRVLDQRMRTADEGRLVSSEEARRRIQQWLSKSATSKTR